MKLPTTKVPSTRHWTLDLQATYSRPEHRGDRMVNLQIQLDKHSYSCVEMPANRPGRQPPCSEFLASAFNTKVVPTLFSGHVLFTA
ncbi:hypothetical protein BV898_02107 [Hypsibius exemplaris]|uniref:Uncharacterized protein n=1 Tax=Hypsibius exemplaris TaxID=2072580 RepID=A0A1W0X9F5_HYPEX|nr:hypothetical protein BV898_02107 [Hypsibius exemplaris]